MRRRSIRERVGAGSWARAREEGRIATAFVRAGFASWIVVVTLAIIVGLILATVALGYAAEPDGTVAIIPIEGSIDGQSASQVSDNLAQARADPDVEAVVLLVNSPGGTAIASEALYMEILRTSQVMPVVTVVDGMAASGAYMAAAPSDEIYVKPASMVGSIGVFVTIPADPGPTEGLVATGPDKLRGQSERGWIYQLDALQTGFVELVMTHRGDELTIERGDVARAKTYVGAEAVTHGLADDIAPRDLAISKAADLAGLDRYDVTVMQRTDEVVFLTRTTYLASDAPNKTLAGPEYFGLDMSAGEVPNFWMVHPSVIPDDAYGDETEVITAWNETAG